MRNTLHISNWHKQAAKFPPILQIHFAFWLVTFSKYLTSNRLTSLRSTLLLASPRLSYCFLYCKIVLSCYHLPPALTHFIYPVVSFISTNLLNLTNIALFQKTSPLLNQESSNVVSRVVHFENDSDKKMRRFLKDKDKLGSSTPHVRSWLLATLPTT
jgi:hypothetical protein